MQKYIFLLELSSHVMPTMACAMAGIYGCGIQESAHLNMKPDIAYRGVVGATRLDALSASVGRNA